MIDVHRITPGLFDRLATGRGGEAAISELRAAQASKHLLLIRYLLEQYRDGGDSVGDLLDRARAAAPEEFWGVVGAPLAGAWAAIAGRAAEQGTLAAADLRYLAAIAIRAAAAAAIDGTAEVPVHHGLVVLPGLGAFEAGDAQSVAVTTHGGRLFVTIGRERREAPAAAATEAPGWLPVRVLTASSPGRPIGLELDDLHPYRHGHHVPPAPRLGPAEVDRWQSTFGEAWRLLSAYLPERAAEIAAGLKTLVPLTQTDPHSARSATIRHAFGVFGLTLPPSPAEFAVTLVHEFQHSKLSAVLDLTQLTDPADDGRYFAPWRTDPRPLAGLLQGVYAFVGVADTWRALRDEVPVATGEFAAARLQVDRGLTAVEESGSLTGDGEAFAAQLRRSADVLLAEPLPAGAEAAARTALARTYAAWRDRQAA